MHHMYLKRRRTYSRLHGVTPYIAVILYDFLQKLRDRQDCLCVCCGTLHFSFHYSKIHKVRSRKRRTVVSFEIQIRCLGMSRSVIAAYGLKAWNFNLWRIQGLTDIGNSALLLGRYNYVGMKQCTDILSHLCGVQLSQIWKWRQVKVTRNLTDEQSRHKVNFITYFLASFLPSFLACLLSSFLPSYCLSYDSY